jgi:cytidine deaminase
VTEVGVDQLLQRAIEVSQKAYAPYSNYVVGAVARTSDGREFAGVNVENGAYPLGLCAEKVALAAAATAGCRPGDIVALATSSTPCGGCRQWLHEWRIPEVHYRREDGSTNVVHANELLPDGWELPE